MKNFISQKYKYDCGVASVYNILKINNINVQYHILLKELNTTTLWGTSPKKITEILNKYQIPFYNL